LVGDDGGMDLGSRLEALGRSLGLREAAHAAAYSQAFARAREIHSQVETGVARFRAALGEAGGPPLDIEIASPRIDDKHIRAVQFDLRRGRHGALVTVKCKGEITLVGPFRIGKQEGPCQSFPSQAESEFDAALGDFIADFLEAAMGP
jgi:hypothetical protein